MGTAQINAIELSSSIVQLKNAKESLKWEYLKTAIVTSYELKVQSRALPAAQSVSSINTDLWQDNNQVLGMIIIYNYFYSKLTRF